MSNLQILSSEIRQTNNLYSLNDLHKASGAEEKHTPNRFMRRDHTKALITEINQTPEMALAQKSSQSGNSRLALKTIKGGKSPGTYACKELVYAYAMWISPKFHLHVIRAFDALQQTANEPSQKPLKLVDKPLPDDLQKLLDERVSLFTGKAYQQIKRDLEERAKDAFSRGSRYMEYFTEWGAESKLALISSNDIQSISAFSKVVINELNELNEKLAEVRA